MKPNEDTQNAVQSAPPNEEAALSPPLAWDLADGDRLWFATQARPWRSLAIVSSAEGLSTHEVARFITALGIQHGEAHRLADVRDVPLKRVGAVLAVVSSLVERGDRVVFAMRSIDSLATVACARAADCVILCVTLGSTSIPMVEETMRMIGKERFLGSILLRRSGAAAMPAADARGPRLLQAAS